MSEVEEGDVTVVETKDWFGMLAVSNIRKVADRLAKMLEGRKYTFVSFNEFSQEPPKFLRGQCLTPETAPNGQAVRAAIGEGLYNGARLIVCDSAGGWQVPTNMMNELQRHDRKDSKFNFVGGRTFVVSYKAGAGNMLIWMVSVEPDEFEQ